MEKEDVNKKEITYTPKISKAKSKEIKLFTPHPLQKRIISQLDLPTTTKVLVNCGRQIGKTTLGWNWLIRECGNNPNSIGLWVSRWHQQANKVYATIAKYIGSAPFVAGLSRIDKEIRFTNGSVIKFRSAHNFEAIRGETVNYLVCDEFALFPREAWEESINPTQAAVQAPKALLLSTPRGKNLWYEMFKAAKRNGTNVIAITAPSTESPYISKEYIKELKETLSDNAFRQEILAEFIDDVGSLFENVEACSVSSGVWNKDKKLYAGLDIGFKNDYTVLTIFDEDYNMIDMFRANDDTQNFDNMVDFIYEVLVRYDFPELAVEINRFDSVATLLKKKGVDIIEFTTTQQSKQKIIENLTRLFSTKKITILNKNHISNPNGIIQEEFYAYEYSYNHNTGNVKFNAPKGVHDDIVMSSALACNLISKDDGYGVNFFF